MSQKIISNTTAAEVSPPFGVNTERTTLIATGTYSGGATAVLQIEAPGAAWVNVIVEGTTQELSETNTVLTVYGTGTYRLNKASSGSATGVAKA